MVYGRVDFSSVGLNGTVHVYGGYTAADFCNPIPFHEVYDPVADAWTALAPMWDNVAEKDDGVVVGGYIYSFGGEKKSVSVGCGDTDIYPVKDVMAYNPHTAVWANVTTLPDARMRFAAAAVNGTVWLFGGQGAVVDGVMIPILTSAYCFAVYGTATPSPAAAVVFVPTGGVYTHSDMAGAVLGTFFATAAVAAVGAALVIRRRYAGKTVLSSAV